MRFPRRTALQVLTITSLAAPAIIRPASAMSLPAPLRPRVPVIYRATGTRPGIGGRHRMVADMELRRWGLLPREMAARRMARQFGQVTSVREITDSPALFSGAFDPTVLHTLSELRAMDPPARPDALLACYPPPATMGLSAPVQAMPP